MWSPTVLELARQQALGVVGSVLGLAEWPAVPLRWNRRLRRAGRAVIEGPRGRVRSARIEISPAYFEVYPVDLHGILVHEAVHVGLALVGLPFGHGPDFRRICRAAGGLLHGRALPGKVLRYRCPVCAAVLERRRPTAGSRWCARCSDAALRRDEDPFLPDRALVLVGVGFQGPLGPEPAPLPLRLLAPIGGAGVGIPHAPGTPRAP